MSKKTKYIVVAGGVISGVGKGVTTASIGKIMQEHGYSTTLIKIDPYINFDAGTLRPTEHGEVWVTEDGGEIDQDLGTYERFINTDIPKTNSITTGQIYQAVIERERNGEYLGETVQFVPHIVDEIIARIKKAGQEYDIAIIEIGGTVGDYENVPYLLAFKSIEREFGADFVAYVLVTYLPIPNNIGEMKTKPTQQAIRLLGQEGIMPDFIICRSQYPLDEIRKKKIEIVGNIAPDHVIAAPDIASVYQVPINFEKQELGKKILSHFNLVSHQKPDWSAWQERTAVLQQSEYKVRIAIVGKYLDSGDFSLTDSYLSICHALQHAGAARKTGVDITWIDAKNYEKDTAQVEELKNFDGVIIPGGFGNSGIEGKVNAINFVRTNNIPFIGLCYGMQLAAIEFARNICNLKDAHTTEVNEQTPYPIIDLLPLQKKLIKDNRYGGTMRLGGYTAQIKENSHVFTLYKDAQRLEKENGNWYVTERHRHRYEVNPKYVSILEQHGLIFSGTHERQDGTTLMEFLELPEHIFFVATQAHPEFTSRLMDPNPLFYGFVAACQENSAMTNDAKKINAALSFNSRREIKEFQ